MLAVPGKGQRRAGSGAACCLTDRISLRPRMLETIDEAATGARPNHHRGLEATEDRCASPQIIELPCPAKMMHGMLVVAAEDPRADEGHPDVRRHQLAIAIEHLRRRREDKGIQA